MKDLYGLRAEDIERLKKLGYLSHDAIAYNDGHSIIDGAPLYVIGFNTSDDRDKAYNILFNKLKDK